MLIITSKWIYLNNKKLECDKSLLIDRSVITDIISNDKIKKDFKNIQREFYDNHLVVPSFSECYLDINDCENEEEYQKKITRIMCSGVTRIQVVSKDYKKALKFVRNYGLYMSFALTLDAADYTQDEMKQLINTLDFYKSDHSIRFSIDLRNILSFENETIKKVAYICNELNLQINFHSGDLMGLNNNDTEKLFSYWDDVNLLNNCAVHDIVTHKKNWMKYLNKKNIILMVKYNELMNLENVEYFLMLIENKYKCVLVSDCENSFKFYDILKIIQYFCKDNEKSFDPYKILDCITTNTVSFFEDLSQREILKKDSLASFNVYNYHKEKFLIKHSSKPILVNLDNKSLTNVWSLGQIMDIKND